MTSGTVRIDGDRLWANLMAMAEIGPGVAGGNNRQALTDADNAGRDLFATWARDAGCTITIDKVGNIFARRDGSDPDAAPVLTGSHLDTQATGGRFDGVYGVLAGLEVIQTLADHDIVTRRPLEIVCWTNEEGCRFAPAMLGSGVVAGVYDLGFAYSRTDRDGIRFDDALDRIGYRGTMAAAARPFAAVFEAHIEQGPILEQSGDTIGVVTGIQGAYWFDVEITGQSCHAGPTPMAMRRDPWRAAVEVIDGVLAIADRNSPYGRCTIGDMRAVPGSRNTVPGSLTFPIDIRHPDATTLQEMVEQMKTLIVDSTALYELGNTITQIWHMPATVFDAKLVASVEAAAIAQGQRWQRVVSGAGHDSLHTAQFAPTAMIFVPCAGGLSHNEAENVTPQDLTAGANVLLEVMVAAAQA